MSYAAMANKNYGIEKLLEAAQSPQGIVASTREPTQEYLQDAMIDATAVLHSVVSLVDDLCGPIPVNATAGSLPDAPVDGALPALRHKARELNVAREAAVIAIERIRQEFPERNTK